MPKKASAVPNPRRRRRIAHAAVARLQSAGFTAYWAGGCVRDLLLDITPKDYDIATDAEPEAVLNIFPHAVAVGKSFGVVRVPIGPDALEIATFRTDADYRDGRRPDRVTFSDPPTDAQRRDFTINAIFYDPVAERYHDFAEGRRDIAARVVRCVGDPEERFSEDHLRMLRAVRFSTVLDFSLHPDTAEAIRRCAPLVKRVSPERIRDEFTRILLEARQPGTALELLEELQLLPAFLPEVADLRGQVQPPEFHPEGDVFTHTVIMLNAMEQRTLHIAYAVLLHDIAKPVTAREIDGRLRFHGHASEGAAMVRRIMRRLRFPGADIEAVVECVRNHMRFIDVSRMRRATLRRLVGAPTFATEIELHRLDCMASHGGLENHDFLVDFSRELEAEPVLPDPWVTGTDVMALGLPEGPEVGRAIRQAYDAQLDGRFASREDLLQWLAGQIHSR